MSETNSTTNSTDNTEGTSNTTQSDEQMKKLMELLKGHVPIAEKLNIFKDASTAMLAITFIFFLGYTVCKIIHNRKSSYGMDVIFSLEINSIEIS